MHLSGARPWTRPLGVARRQGWMVGLFFGLVLVAPGATLAASLAPGGGDGSPTSVSDPGSAVVARALGYVGTRYSWYGASPATGFTCTGLVQWVYRAFGITTPMAPAQLYHAYPKIDRASLHPGDVLLFHDTVYPGLSHAAIYVGGDKMVGADNYAMGVHVDSLASPFWAAHYSGAVRPLASQASTTAPADRTPASPPAAPASNPPAAPSPAPDLTTASDSRVGKPVRLVDVPQLNLRSGPDVGNPILERLYAGNSLAVVGEQAGWSQVLAPDGTKGWVINTALRDPAAPAADDGQATGPASSVVVDVDALRVRNAPQYGGKVVNVVYDGTRLTVRQRQAGWLQVTLPDGTDGWVVTSHVRNPGDPVGSSPGAGSETASARVKTKVDSLRLRVGPGSGFSVVRGLPQGTALTVVARKPGWLQVTLSDGSSGWVDSEFVA